MQKIFKKLFLNKSHWLSKVAVVFFCLGLFLTLNSQVALGQSYSAVCSGISSFNRDLYYGFSGYDVKCLQGILNADPATMITGSGAGSLGNETTFFGPSTQVAVIKFQEKYASEVLAPFGLTYGTGYVGSSTRSKLNSILAGGSGAGAGVSSLSPVPLALAPMPAVLKGGSVFMEPSDGWLNRLIEAGGNSVFVNFAWKKLEKNLVLPLPSMVALSQGQGIEDYAKAVDWTKFDNLAKKITNKGLFIIPWVGDGLTQNDPLGLSASGENDVYQRAVYRFLRAFQARYRFPLVFVADELNEAEASALFGYRQGTLWTDFSAVTNLVKIEAQAIKDAKSASLVGVSFATDFHEDIHHHTVSSPADFSGSMLIGPNSWQEALSQWIGFIDYVGVNAFPYYYNASFQGYEKIGAELGERVALAKSLAGNKPVLVTSTAYPIPKSGYGFSAPADYTATRQKIFLENAFDSSLSNGAKGFFWFDVLSSGMTGPSGGYTQWDLNALKTVGSAFRNGEAQKLIDWLLANITKKDRLATILTSVEKGWGLGQEALDALKSRWGAPVSPIVSTCSDSDGENINAKGVAIANGVSYYDICSTASALTEYICLGANLSSKSIACPYGCENGACKQAPVSPAISCSDTDSRDPYTKGTTIANSSITYYDSCLSESTVLEYFCLINIAVTTTNSCIYGCENGACKQSSTVSLPAGLRFALDENTGQYVRDASDASLYGTLGLTNAVGSDDPAWLSGSNCQEGSCLNFDGVDDTVVFDNKDINTTSGGKNTVAFWMYWKGNNGVMPFGWNVRYTLFLYNNAFGFNTGNGNVEGFSGTDYLKNSWHYVVVVFPNNQAPNHSNAAIWIDGVNKGVGHQFGGSPTIKTATDVFYLSGRGPSVGYKFDGLIDEFRLYNRELSKAEIRALYTSPASSSISYSDTDSVSCSDTDSKDPFTKGTTIANSSITYYDSCLSESTVLEYFCLSNIAVTTTNSCIYGCENGACKQAPVSPSVSCSDSDGNDIYTKGATLVNGATTYTDVCSAPNTLTEYICNGANLVAIPNNCVYGCDDGACRKASPPPPIPISSALYFPLDEGSGQYVRDASDASLYGTLGLTNAVGSDDPAWLSGSDCQEGSCLNFDGVNDYVVSNNKMAVNNSYVTISAWVYRKNNGTGIYPGIVSYGEGSIAGNSRALLFTSANKVGIFVQGSLGGGRNNISSYTLPVNTWVHIVATYNGSKQTIYINGQPYQSWDNAVGVLNGSKYVYIGKNHSTSFFGGLVDDVRIYGRILSEAEIQALYTPKAIEPPSSTCSDTDSRDPYTKGTTIANNSITYYDSCLSNSTVLEYFCLSNLAVTTTNSCIYGCENGACKQAPIADSFSISLAKGWNIISIPIQPADTNLKTVLSSINGKFDRVIGEAGAYDSSLSDTFNSLKTIEPGKGYEIHMLQAATLTISGTKFNYSTSQWVSSLSLPVGWNEIGVTLNSPTSIVSANLSPYGYIIQTYNPYETDKTLLQAFSDLNGRKDFTNFEPGKGYWVKIKDRCSADADCNDLAGYCSTAYPNIKCNTTSGSCYCAAGSSLPSPVIQMKLDENTGQYVRDASDSSLYGTLGLTNAVGSDDPAWLAGSDCKSGSCLSFDGVDDRVVFSNMPVDTSADSKNTVAFWMYWKGKNGVMPLSFGYPSFNLYLRDNAFGINTGNGNVEGFSGTDYLKNSWHYVVAVFPNNQAPNSSNAALWIDGVNKGISHRFGSGPTAKPMATKIYFSGYGSGYYNFDGLIDDFRLYNYQLTDSQVEALYGSGLVWRETSQELSIQDLIFAQAQLANISQALTELTAKIRALFNK